MEIQDNRINPSVTQENSQSAAIETKGNRDADASPGKSATAGGSNDRISFTDAARLLQDLEIRIAESPVVDSNRVAEVRNAVDNGTFTVDPARIADKMISLETALTGAR